MTQSPIDQFRAQFVPPAPTLVVNKPGERRLYRAYQRKDRVIRLEVRYATGLSNALLYSYMPVVTTDWLKHDGLLLEVPGLRVMAKGQNLAIVEDAIKAGSCEFIQEFTRDHFLDPEDPLAPIITSIIWETTESRVNQEREDMAA